MTPTTIALIAIPSAAALAFMWWAATRAPVIEDEPCSDYDPEFDGPREGETFPAWFARMSETANREGTHD